MIVLGIVNNDVSGACLVENNKILAAAHEERFTRIKNDNQWPTQAIHYVLNSQKKAITDIDYLAYGWNKGFDQEQHLMMYFDRIVEETNRTTGNINALRKRIQDEINNDKGKKHEFIEYAKKWGLEDKIHYVDHHECHAAGAFLCSSYEQALVITCDGRGDFQSLTVREYKNNQQKVLHRDSSADSLGYFYGRMTKLLGFKPNRHEGKLTGLAAYGDPNKLLGLMHQMISIEKGHIRSHMGDFYQPSYHNYSSLLEAKIEQAKKADVAAATQVHTENILIDLITPYVEATGQNNLCLSGGVFANVKLNQRIKEIEGVENIYVLPCMGDGGLALGAAIDAVYKKTHTKPTNVTMDLGPDFKDSYRITQTIKNLYPTLQYSLDKNVAEEVIKALKQNSVIGLFRGKMEFGPRALCKRSIIYHASDKKMNDWLNQRLKRTEFMPFAPITAENLANLCYINWKKEDLCSHFMTMTYNCTEHMINKCPAVVHIDGTARPQVITQNHDPFMYKLLNQWHRESDQPALVNTSFNRHEEPIVCDPSEALSVLQDNIIELLVFNDELVVWK